MWLKIYIKSNEKKTEKDDRKSIENNNINVGKCLVLPFCMRTVGLYRNYTTNNKNKQSEQ